MWVFDRLLGLEVPASVLVEHILPAVAASADDLPDATAAKLRLRLLDEDTDLGRVDETTLSYLQQLESCRVGPLADEARVCPPHGLLLKVGHWRCGVALSALVPAASLVAQPYTNPVPGLHPSSFEGPAAPAEPASQSSCPLPARCLTQRCALPLAVAGPPPCMLLCPACCRSRLSSAFRPSVTAP